MSAVLDIAAMIAKLIVTDPVIVKERADVVHCCLSDVIQGLFSQEGLM